MQCRSLKLGCLTPGHRGTLGAGEGDQDTGLFFPEVILQQIFTYHFLCTRQNGGANVIPHHHGRVGWGGWGSHYCNRWVTSPPRNYLPGEKTLLCRAT